jgi:hypothetical protein
MSALKNYYPKENIGVETMDLWYIHLKDLPFTAAETSLKEWVNENRWPPTIADIRLGVKDIYWRALEQSEGEEFLEIYKLIKELDNEKQIQATKTYKAICQM